MIPKITLTLREQELGHLAVVVSKLSRIPAGVLTAAEKKYLKEQVEDLKQEVVSFNRLSYQILIIISDADKERDHRLEGARKAGDQVAGRLNALKATKVTVFDAEGMGEEVLAFAEGMALGCYQFLKYKQDRENENTLMEIELYSAALDDEMVSRESLAVSGGSLRVERMNCLLKAIFRCRDLVNEPFSHLTAAGFAREAVRMGKEAGITVEVLNRQKIAALKMGGLLGVNLGSHEPPTFTVMEWKPAGARNNKPLVLVGKGVMYDTGGMNLKPGNSMMHMKDDMAGAAAVAATLYAVAMANLPVHVVGLMPATDNRPGAKSLVSGDIITMHNGMTVEVIDTDAEGRLILGDALSYARNYDPMLVVDLATLTGSAVRAIGKFAAAAMHSGARNELDGLIRSGFNVYERLVEFPMWEEYGDQIKSDIADIKNLGPPEAGLITAAKFLEKFTGYPYIHLDIAGPAFLENRDSYRGQGATAFGVRLLFDYIVNFAKNA